MFLLVEVAVHHLGVPPDRRGLQLCGLMTVCTDRGRCRLSTHFSLVILFMLCRSQHF